MKKKLNHSQRKGVCPSPPTPVKYSHLCEIDKRTRLDSQAWHNNNSSGAKRVDAIRHLHEAAGSHEAAVAAVADATARNKNQTIDTVQTRTIVRAVKRLADI